jgi:hypothetical protein
MYEESAFSFLANINVVKNSLTDYNYEIDDMFFEGIPSDACKLR